MTTQRTRPTMVIVAFSPLARDARVLKQIRHFADHYAVTTVGYGPVPDPRVEHLELPASSQNELDGRLITLRAYRLAHRAVPAVRATRALLRGRRFDVGIADDVETIPVVFGVVDRTSVLADLHEYSPRLHEENAAWNRRIAPYYAWLTRRFAARSGVVTTVGQGLADEYLRSEGVRCQVVTNAAPYAELAPAPVGGNIRLVHSGACLRNRQLMEMIDAVAASSTPVSLDLYLTPNDPQYLQELRDRAASLSNVRVNDAVPYESLVATLNGFDVGIALIPPVTFSYRWSLPNKLFDYVQARLAVAIGPSPEMARIVEDHRLGPIADGFATGDLTNLLDALTPEAVTRFKAASHAAARELSAGTQIAVWERLVRSLPGSRR
ncbi:glycosyltransferase family 1 protein [Xylanimonas ulmi]|uniref:D-inositol 3-phosphate glycosyltransferase n=1 Tax=Xylanimonas ulmi TaxID=228973 RepID=A0A4Q7M1Z1_9MICO|nr:glycosyltransferase family 1 protein [Xylanibacterium ulmi]RZS59929.1 hypothetical protein EV386_0166 [Xylanibacterium ulmi]